jgi:hypothetical protein
MCWNTMSRTGAKTVAASNRNFENVVRFLRGVALGLARSGGVSGVCMAAYIKAETGVGYVVEHR